MSKNNFLYKNQSTKKVFFNEEDRYHYMNLLRVLFRLGIIDEDTTVDIAIEFQPFFV
jgi:hypothetical protein